ncbi:GspE/PulE family protein [Rhodanobacter denitrificans]|uniref:Type II secretory pathway, ATPase PulE/Tfp pilus assembly pathway, ATPase PilB n=1 Tax=Rhodanobacter denitrificans TaxID=666685 RepID=M4NN58_9GAMM|nr:ATPase, T2SS/T4P/T4SS family [Rhodanobacter denitrificans]AGG89136.1 type II secretory pathway, ATPase PulE/Tfp pilus assembly pathway, ATPase PilB [Rhodanobacter denitrificans]UJJ52959.1 Flp pilus assembly complex ATPase component TadA [Rhodanobacter denitrificans]
MSAQLHTIATDAPAPAPQNRDAGVDVTRVLEDFPRILSNEPGPLRLDDPLQREVMCLCGKVDSNVAVLLVSSTHYQQGTDDRFTEYRSLARSQGVAARVIQTTVSQIASKYAGEDSAAASKLVDSHEKARVLAYIRQAAARNASDLKFQIVGDFCSVRLKVHGRSRSIGELSAEEGYRLIRSLYNSMVTQGQGDLNPRAMQDGQLRPEYAKLCGLTGSRIATRPAKDDGLLVTFRLLYASNRNGKSLTSLGYTPDQLELLDGMLRRKYGINLFTGVTGSGKSTSLVACMQKLLRDHHQELDLITIEDPVEYDIEGAGSLQTPMLYDIHDPVARAKAWGDALRNCLRHAPNVLMPGELRDGDGAVTAFNIALSGHQVWSTLHTFDVFSAIQRLIEMGVDASLVTNPALLTGVINQSLVRTLCPHCKVPLAEHRDRLEPHLLAQVDRLAHGHEIFIAGPGCRHCEFGVGDREVAAEVLVPNAELMQVYQKEGMLAARIHWVTRLGGVTRLAHALQKMRAGIVDPLHIEQDVDPLDTDFVTLGVWP